MSRERLVKIYVLQSVLDKAKMSKNEFETRLYEAGKKILGMDTHAEVVG